MRTIKPLKRFGQNYLFDQNIINKIVAEINPQKKDNIIEIGPGHGSLTEKILEKTNSLTAIEIDRRIKEELQNKFANLKLISEDVLKIDFRKIVPKKKRIRVVGNIPYNITSPIIFKMIEYNDVIEDSVLMVQYEVAKRLKGKKGTKDYGILSVLLKFFSEVKFCFKVSPSSFYPKPNVFSAVVHLFFSENKIDKELKQILIQIIKASFGNRRKTLKNSLGNSIFSNINFDNSSIDLAKRAEQLDSEDFLMLARFVQKRIEKQIDFTNQL
jgi:16S rRNA (adenine1518-N6/adenine1519-N6)-dimethyltransferase